MPDRGERLASFVRRWRDDLLVVTAALIPLALFIVRERQIAGAAGFPLDDSWIHLHFARNLAAGAGFSYNPGVPIAGSTAPLWTLLLGAGAVVASASLAMAKVVGIVATVGAAVVTRRAALAWAARSDVALITSIALLWMGPIVWGALSGMEVSLAALLVATALLAHAHDAHGLGRPGPDEHGLDPGRQPRPAGTGARRLAPAHRVLPVRPARRAHRLEP